MIRRRMGNQWQYLYSKSIDASQRALFEKKRRIRAALKEGEPIPTELCNEEHKLRRQMDLEDQEPRGELKVVFPMSQRMNRGGQVTRHDIKGRKAMGKMSKAYPHLVLDNFSTWIGERTATILKHLFPMPKPDSKRIITFANRDERHVYKKSDSPRSIDLKEVGPRLELRLYQIKLGTVEQNDARSEFVLQAYNNTAKKQKTVGA